MGRGWSKLVVRAIEGTRCFSLPSPDSLISHSALDRARDHNLRGSWPCFRHCFPSPRCRSSMSLSLPSGGMHIRFPNEPGSGYSWHLLSARAGFGPSIVPRGSEERLECAHYTSNISPLRIHVANVVWPCAGPPLVAFMASLLRSPSRGGPGANCWCLFFPSLVN